MVAIVLRTALLVLLALNLPVLAEDECEELDKVLEEIYLSPYEPAAAYDAWSKRLMELIDHNLYSPAASLLFDKLRDLHQVVVDPRPLESFLLALPAKEIPNGLLRLQALAAAREMQLVKGRYDDASRSPAFEAYARNVLVAGPFGFNTRSLHHVPFAPENELELTRSYPGYASEVTWQVITRDEGTTAIEPFESLYPKAGCCYALYQFCTGTARPLLLLFGHRGSTKIWFNGKQVLDSCRERETRRKTALVAVQGRSGWNRVLIKLSSRQEAFALVVTDGTGHPLTDLEECAEVALHPIGDPKMADVEAPLLNLQPLDTIAFLRAYTQGKPNSVPARLALAKTLFEEGLESEALRHAEKAYELNPECAHTAALLGRLYRKAGYLPLNYRNNRSREMYKQAVRLKADFLPARLALARYDHENDRSEEAIESLEKIIAENPDYSNARLALAYIFFSLGWSTEGLMSVRQAIEQAPHRAEAYEELARYYQAHNRDDLALPQLQRSLARDGSNRALAEEVADALWARGDMTTALELTIALAATGESKNLTRKLAARYRALGDGQRARTILEQLSARYDGKPRLLNKLADFLLEEGCRDEAVALYEQVLRIAPDQHDVRALLREMGVPGHEDLLFEEFAVLGEDYMSDLPGKEEFPKASSIVSLDHQITRVFSDGSSVSRIHQVIKILDKNAVEQYGQLQLPGRLEMVRTITADGTVLEPNDAEEESGSFSMPGLDVGSIVETCFTVTDSNSPGSPLDLGRFYFQDVEGSHPFLFSRFVVALPKDLAIVEEVTLPEMMERQVLERGDEIVYVYTARDAPVVEKERLMPPDEDAFPNVNFVQYRGWAEVAQIFANLRDPNVIPTAEIEAKAAEIVGDEQNDLEKARKLYDFVNELVKDDEGSNEAIEVLFEAQGNRTSLFMALLEAAGVEYDHLRCGLNPGYLKEPQDWSKIELNFFSRELIRLHAGEQGADPTLVSMASRMMPFGEIPPYLFGAPAIEVCGFPETVETLPGGDPRAYLETEIELYVEVRGTNAIITGTMTFPGFGRFNLQDQLQRMDTARRRQVFEYGLMRSIYPGARVTDLEISGIDETGAVPTFTFALEAQGFVFPSGERQACKLLPQPPELTRAFIRKPDRQFPMMRRGYSQFHTQIEVDLGKGYSLERLPQSLISRRFFLNYALVTCATERGFRVEQTMEFGPGDLQPGEYSELIEMLKSIDERIAEPVIVR